MARRSRRDEEELEDDEFEESRDEDDEEEERAARRRRRRRRLAKEAIGRLAAPAISLLIIGIIGLLYALFSTFVHFFEPFGPPPNFAFGNPNAPGARLGRQIGGLIGAVFPPISNLIVIIGAWQMKNAQMYGLAITASIVACVPCCSPCLVLGIPFGIWALVVLSSKEVRDVFS